MLAPFESPDCDAVFGSRMMRKGAARLGGMPFYKRVGNRILTRFENRRLGIRLTEFHSGYRAYRHRHPGPDSLRGQQRRLRLRHPDHRPDLHAGGRIVEVPIPTYYGDEICYVNGMKYAADVVRDVLEFQLAVRGFGTSEWVPTPDQYDFKDQDGSSHAAMLDMTSDPGPSRILDLGCSGGLLAEKRAPRGT